MKFILTILVFVNGAPAVGELEGTFDRFTNKAMACTMLVEAAKKVPGAIRVLGCDLRIEI